MNNLFQLENFTRRKLPTKFYSGLSGLLQDLGIDGNDVVDDFITNYVNHAFKKSQTKSSVYLTTGFSRHVVNKCLENQSTKKTKKRNTHYLLLLGELKKLSNKYKGGLIPIHGKFGSYTSAFNQTKPSDNIITAKGMLDNLLTIGVLNKHGDMISFETTLQTKGLFEPDSIINLLTSLMYRLSMTLYHNLQAKTNEDTLFQMTYYSNSIIPSKRKELTDGLRELARKHIYEYQTLIDSYEDTDISNQGIEDLNNEIGISSFIFNNKNEE